MVVGGFAIILCVWYPGIMWSCRILPSAILEPTLAQPWGWWWQAVLVFGSANFCNAMQCQLVSWCHSGTAQNEKLEPLVHFGRAKVVGWESWVKPQLVQMVHALRVVMTHWC